MRLILMTAFVLGSFGFVSAPATAQQINQRVVGHAVAIANRCLGKWDTQHCLRTVSASNNDLVSIYAAQLDKAGKKNQLEPLKQKCAAAAVVVEEEVPAYAYKSAYTECANHLYDVSQNTKVPLDKSHYQLLVGAVLCLSEAPQCKQLEAQMKPYMKK